MKLPFLQFFTGDWMKDTQVSMCQPATRGILFDALCAMHESGRSSLQGTPEQLSRVLRCSPPDLSTALQDLRQTGAVDVRDNGHGLVTITSRRMERDLKGRLNATNRKRKERGQPPLTEPSTTVVTLVSRDSHRDISEVRSQIEQTHNTLARADLDLDDSEVLAKPDALALAKDRLGIPEDFAGMVYEAWKGNGGCNGNRIPTPWPRQVNKRWQTEGEQWKAGTHSQQKRATNGHASPKAGRARAEPDTTPLAVDPELFREFQAAFPEFQAHRRIPATEADMPDGMRPDWKNYKLGHRP